MAEAHKASNGSVLDFSELHRTLNAKGNVAKILEQIGMAVPLFCGAIRDITQDFVGAWHPDLDPNQPSLLSELHSTNDISTPQRAQQFFVLFFGQSFFYPDILLESPTFYAKRQAKVEKAIQAGLLNFSMSRRQYDALEEEIRTFCKKHVAPRSKHIFDDHMEKFFSKMNDNLVDDEDEMDQYDLDIFGQKDFLLQQGPHSAILACHKGWNHSAQEYFPLNEPENFPTNGKTIAKAYWGPVQRHHWRGEYIVSKTINLKKLEKNKIAKQKWNDYPPNEIATHRYLCQYHDDCPGVRHEKPSPYIISLKGVTKEEAGQMLFYYMEFGNDYFSYISENYDKASKEWKKWLRKQPNARKLKHTKKSQWETDRCKDFIKLARGLEYMHKLGVAHRDFKLENIVRVKGVVKLIDFGVAHRFGYWERKTFACNDRVGTATYMSPECYVAEHRKSDVHLARYDVWDAVANDIWTLGIALFMMMFACPPYDTCSNADTRFMFLTAGKYVPQRKKNKIPRNASLQALVKAYGRQNMVTDACLNFLEQFFLPEEKRITMEKIWKHEWLRDVLR